MLSAHAAAASPHYEPFIVEAHLPNFNDEDVTIQVENNYLVVSAERHEKEEDKDKKYVVRESSSSFYRRISLPERADREYYRSSRRRGVESNYPAQSAVCGCRQKYSPIIYYRSALLDRIQGDDTCGYFVATSSRKRLEEIA